MNIVRFYTFTKREFDRFFRIPVQTLVSPWISALLFIFIFGSVIGSRIQLFSDFRYIDFVLPGILMMNVVVSAFGQSSSSLFFQRFTRSIEEVLTAPISYLEMVLGYILGAIIRSMVVATGIFILGLFFTSANLDHIFIFFFYIIIVSIIFSLLGLLIGLWAEKFEHLNVLQVFVITPLLYVGGVFSSIEMLPETLQKIAKLNPFFYMINGLRYSMISFKESDVLFGSLFLILFAAILFVWVLLLFRKGYKLRS